MVDSGNNRVLVGTAGGELLVKGAVTIAQVEMQRHGVATMMLLGDVCTRGCRFCAVTSGHPGGVVDPHEPHNVGRAVAEMDLAYVVLTMVDRDDLPDAVEVSVYRER